MSQDKQTQLRQLAMQQDGKLTFQDAVTLLQHNYYCNAEKYVSEILCRMVRNGTLVRLCKGQYELNLKGISPKPESVNNLNLFE